MTIVKSVFIEKYNREINSGKTKSYIKLGDCYSSGEDRDVTKACICYLKALKYGYTEVVTTIKQLMTSKEIIDLGDLLLSGDSCIQDKECAFLAYKILDNNVYARLRLAECYLYGYGTDYNFDEAIKLYNNLETYNLDIYKDRIEQGLFLAYIGEAESGEYKYLDCINLRITLGKSVDDNLKIRIGKLYYKYGEYLRTLKNNASSKHIVANYVKATEYGNHEAELALAEIYREGKYCEKNIPLAIKYYERSINGGVDTLDNICLYERLMSEKQKLTSLDDFRKIYVNKYTEEYNDLLLNVAYDNDIEYDDIEKEFQIFYAKFHGVKRTRLSLMEKPQNFLTYISAKLARYDLVKADFIKPYLKKLWDLYVNKIGWEDYCPQINVSPDMWFEENYVKDGNYIYHLTTIDNLSKILYGGLKTRNKLNNNELAFEDTASAAILAKRHLLNRYIPFHFIPATAYDYVIKRDYGSKNLCYILLKRNINNRFSDIKYYVINCHPTSTSWDGKLYEYDDGYDTINWEALSYRQCYNYYYNERYKHVRMAECLVEGNSEILDPRYIAAILVTDENVDKVQKIVYDACLPIKVFGSYVLNMEHN